MATILVMYGSSHGQTKKIAERIAVRLRERSIGAVLLDANAHPRGAPLPPEIDGIAVCGRVHGGTHPRSLRKIVRQNRALLQSVPSLFVSVSGSASRDDTASRHETAAHIDGFVTKTGWQPLRVAAIAGAIPYTRYGLFLRWMIKRISATNGGPTDTSRDWEFTDWAAVDRIAYELADLVMPVLPVRSELQPEVPM